MEGKRGLLTLALGSNLGDREANLQEAARQLGEEFAGAEITVSDALRTEAEGFAGKQFLNCALCLETDLDPREVLGICKKIEKRMGRTDSPEYDASGRRIYHDRIIDIDILTYGDLEIREKDLTIPHPQVKTRSYIPELLLNLHEKLNRI